MSLRNIQNCMDYATDLRSVLPWARFESTSRHSMLTSPKRESDHNLSENTILECKKFFRRVDTLQKSLTSSSE